uniref:Uncharacterized protein n=1 Tax=Arundo donax TaxID=35708 RepID=A0A0A8Y343_ARUDO
MSGRLALTNGPEHVVLIARYIVFFKSSLLHITSCIYQLRGAATKESRHAKAFCCKCFLTRMAIRVTTIQMNIIRDIVYNLTDINY